MNNFQCCIDLKKNCLVFGSADISVPFLSEGEIKKPFGAGHSQSKKEDEKIKPESTQPSTLSGGSKGVQIGGSTFPENDITQLTNLGFSRQQAVSALKACGGNVEMAASLLFQQGGGF